MEVLVAHALLNDEEQDDNAQGNHRRAIDTFHSIIQWAENSDENPNAIKTANTNTIGSAYANANENAGIDDVFIVFLSEVATIDESASKNVTWNVVQPIHMCKQKEGKGKRNNTPCLLTPAIFFQIHKMEKNKSYPTQTPSPHTVTNKQIINDQKISAPSQNSDF